MNDVAGRRFAKDIKGKVIIALLLACVALFLAWGVSKIAFKEMLNTVEYISAPSERLRIVNAVSRKIGSLDQLQKKQAFDDPGNYRKLFKESRQLRVLLDTLGQLYASDSLQLSRIATIKKLLSERDKQFINYLKVRERLINNKSFSKQVQALNEIVTKGVEQADSTILATEQKTSTTTIYPTEEKSRGFFGKLFGKKKTDNRSFKIVNEEKVKRDTIALSAEDKMVKNLEKSLRVIELEHKKNNASFLNREAVLANANSMLINQMLDVLRKVESEVVSQIELNAIQAKRVVNTGINTITIIMLVFLLLTGLLLYFIFTDITRSSRYRAELEKARDEAEYHGLAKQRFLSNMSHEIRTPLQSIIGYTEIIRHQDSPKKKDIDAIYNSSEHLLQIVNEVLDYNRIVSGNFTFSDKIFDLNMLLEEVLSVMRPQAKLKSLRMQADLELETATYVKGDPFRLKQILYNLLGNAIKFTASGEVVLAVGYKRQEEKLHFTFKVKDTGIGLTEKESSLIFNEFEQASNSENELINRTGTGLGLTIVKSLVEHQGGRIYVKSKKAEGSIFTVYLTFAAASAPELESLQVLQDNRRYKDKVWIVDDDQLILDLCEIIFQKNGIDYQSFHSPSQLLNAEWDNEVKYILMDMRMPEMDGIELCRLLRERGERGAHGERINDAVKIYAITAQVLPDEREFLLGNGFDGLVMKPFREAELLNVFNEEDMEDDYSFEASALDLSGLKKMTFGDEQQLHRIILRFLEDSTNDIEELKTALSENDLETLCLLTHRLAGRTAQLGAKALAQELRGCELELRKLDELKYEARNELAALLGKLSGLIDYLKQQSLIGYSIS